MREFVIGVSVSVNPDYLKSMFTPLLTPEFSPVIL